MVTDSLLLHDSLALEHKNCQKLSHFHTTDQSMDTADPVKRGTSSSFHRVLHNVRCVGDWGLVCSEYDEEAQKGTSEKEAQEAHPQTASFHTRAVPTESVSSLVD